MCKRCGLNFDNSGKSCSSYKTGKSMIRNSKEYYDDHSPTDHIRQASGYGNLKELERGIQLQGVVSKDALFMAGAHNRIECFQFLLNNAEMKSQITEFDLGQIHAWAEIGGRTQIIAMIQKFRKKN